MSAWRRCVVVSRSFLLLLGLAGCETIAGGPERLYTVSEEKFQAGGLLTALQNDYDTAQPGSVAQAYYRNEYIARRMYVIDVEYSKYEAGLTSEKQIFSFGADTTAEVLNVVGAATTAGATSRVLNGVAGGVGAVNGYYDKDLIIAKTIQIAEGQMRAARDTVALRILQRRGESTLTYPLSAALSDLEDYYRAGTLNTGLIAAQGDSSNNATIAASNKTIAVKYGSNASTATLAACLNKTGAETKLVALMTPHSHAALVALAFDTSPAGESARSALLAQAKAQGICP